jgi:hypothetical protein
MSAGVSGGSSDTPSWIEARARPLPWLGAVVALGLAMPVAQAHGPSEGQSADPDESTDHASADQDDPAAEGPVVIEHSELPREGERRRRGSPPAGAHGDPSAEQGRGIEYGAHLVVPIWLTKADFESGSLPGDDPLRLDPGVGIQGRVGWEFAGGLSTELFLGYSSNRFEANEAERLTNLWVGAGMRYSFLNPSAFVPFIGASAQINFWSACAGDPKRDVEVCVDSEASVGVNASFGLIFEATRNIGLEVGAVVHTDVAIDVFDRFEAYVAPFAGATFYF